MSHNHTLRRLLAIALLFGGLTLAPAAEAEAGIFGRSRVSKGTTIRGRGPIKFRVSSAKARRLTTFYPTVFRRVP